MTETKTTAGARTQTTMTAGEILEWFGICVDSERLSDGSKVYGVSLSENTVDCISEKHANDLAFDIAVAIRNHTNL